MGDVGIGLEPPLLCVQPHLVAGATMRKLGCQTAGWLLGRATAHKPRPGPLV